MSASIAMKLFPLNHARAFVFGDALLRMGDDQSMFFSSRSDALRVAKERGIQVAEDGTCFVRVLDLPGCFEAEATSV